MKYSINGFFALFEIVENKRVEKMFEINWMK